MFANQRAFLVLLAMTSIALDPVRADLSPSTYPTSVPSIVNTEASIGPASQLSSVPTKLPTVSPSTYPTFEPSIVTAEPSIKPRSQPSSTKRPANLPTSTPTQLPTVSPSTHPTFAPSNVMETSISLTPTQSPTVSPSTYPTFAPSNVTTEPSIGPASQPFTAPTQFSTVSPSTYPTFAPSNVTAEPSIGPASLPTSTPTQLPSISPSTYPTLAPSNVTETSISLPPTQFPSVSPSTYPTFAPSNVTIEPSIGPASEPSTAPTQLPSVLPSAYPTFAPSNVTETSISLTPTQSPSVSPSTYPTFAPSNASQPSTAPKQFPSVSPSAYPTFAPSIWPTNKPSLTPKAPTPSPLSTKSQEEFIMETIMANESSNPWCLDAYECNTNVDDYYYEYYDETCSGSRIGLRPCDSESDTQLFVQDYNNFIYLAKKLDFCFEVNDKNQLTVVYCSVSRRKLKVNAAGIRRFDVSTGKLVALGVNGTRYPVALDTNSTDNGLIFVEEGDPAALNVTQIFVSPTAPPATPLPTKSPQQEKIVSPPTYTMSPSDLPSSLPSKGEPTVPSSPPLSTKSPKSTKKTPKKIKDPSLKKIKKTSKKKTKAPIN